MQNETTKINGESLITYTIESMNMYQTIYSLFYERNLI